MPPFKEAVRQAMRMLGEQNGTIFIGQSVKYDGAAIYDSLDLVPMHRRLEFPVAEDLQLGFCTGLALAGRLPICIYPRMDFMLLCMNQLVNHLDKLPMFGWKPKVIIRARVGSLKPLNAGPQHTQNYCEALRSMLKNTTVIECKRAEDVSYAYNSVMWPSARSAVVVENPGEGY